MITAFKELTENSISSPTEYRGLSTDSKPSANNGDVFFEINTGKVFMYNADSSAWVEL